MWILGLKGLTMRPHHNHLISMDNPLEMCAKYELRRVLLDVILNNDLITCLRGSEAGATGIQCCNALSCSEGYSFQVLLSGIGYRNHSLFSPK